MASGWQGAPCFNKYARELLSKPAISLKKTGGATVERLIPEDAVLSRRNLPAILSRFLRGESKKNKTGGKKIKTSKLVTSRGCYGTA